MSEPTFSVVAAPAAMSVRISGAMACLSGCRAVAGKMALLLAMVAAGAHLAWWWEHVVGIGGWDRWR